MNGLEESQKNRWNEQQMLEHVDQIHQTQAESDFEQKF